MGCFYCDEHCYEHCDEHCDEHIEVSDSIMFKVGGRKAGVLYLFRDQAHKGRFALGLKSHKKELCECDEQERNDYCADLAAASGAIKKTVGCTRINPGSFGDINPHLHFHIVPKYEGGFESGGSFEIINPNPVILKEGEYQEMIAALQKEPGFCQKQFLRRWVRYGIGYDMVKNKRSRKPKVCRGQHGFSGQDF